MVTVSQAWGTQGTGHEVFWAEAPLHWELNSNSFSGMGPAHPSSLSGLLGTMAQPHWPFCSFGHTRLRPLWASGVPPPSLSPGPRLCRLFHVIQIFFLTPVYSAAGAHPLFQSLSVTVLIHYSKLYLLVYHLPLHLTMSSQSLPVSILSLCAAPTPGLA